VNLQPVSGFAPVPLQQIRPADMVAVPVGVPIASLAPKNAGILVCRVNGEWLLRESWESLTQPGDVIEWHDVPQDRDTLRGVLTIASLFIPQLFALQGFAAFAAVAASQLAINLLLPPTGPTSLARPENTGDAFSTSLQGNEARLDQPIWKICGQREITPPYAAQPYFEYRTRPGDSDADPDLDNDQYFLALFAVGIGNHDVVAKIGNTPITRFADVVRATYLAPGVQPTEVLANVTTAVEVSSATLESGRFVGGYAACAARRTCSAIGVDVSAVRGLGKTGALTVTWRVEYREINDFGQVLGPWTVLADETRTAFTATPQRWSEKYTLPTAARVEVRLVRTDVQDTDPSALHELAWIGLRAYLAEPARLNPEAAHFEVVMRASSQLSQSASRDLRLICQAYCRTLAADLTWNAEEHTRNWVWWCLDLITSSTWGMNKPDSRIDLQSFYDLAVQADARQDRFDYVFDSTLNGWDAAQLIARAGRSRVFRRNGVISIARDEFVDAPVTAFTPRNCQPGIAVSEKLRSRNSPDGFIVEYQDHRTNEWTEIACPMPGVELSDMANPEHKRLEGIVGAKHAEREGLYEAANLAYRTRVASFTTEMQGMLPAYMSPVALVPDQVGYAQSGDVVSYDGSLAIELSEEPDWDAGDLYITFIKDDGLLTDPQRVTPGTTSYDVTLSSAPAFTLVLDDGTRERPKFLLGPLLGSRELVKVGAITDGGLADEGAQLFEISGVIDDERVHTADNALLPGPGEIQDPVGLPDAGGPEPGVVLLIPNILDVTTLAFTTSGVSVSSLGTRYRLGATGLLHYTEEFSGVPINYDPAGQWLLYGEAEPSDCALFEVRATLLSSSGAGAETFTGPIGTWEVMGVDIEWYLEYGGGGDSSRTLFIEIRETATGLVADFATVTLQTAILVEVGGA
jgi:hypothetical protein